MDLEKSFPFRPLPFEWGGKGFYWVFCGTHRGPFVGDFFAWFRWWVLLEFVWSSPVGGADMYFVFLGPRGSRIELHT